MSLSLPITGTAQRELFEVADLVALTTGVRPLGCLPQALAQARRSFRANKAISRIAYIILQADDNVALITVGRRGGRKTEWVFGPVPRSVRLT